MLDYSYSLCKETRRLSTPRASTDANGHNIQNIDSLINDSLYSGYDGNYTYGNYETFSCKIKPAYSSSMPLSGSDNPIIDLDIVSSETDKFKRRLSQTNCSSSRKEI